MRIFLFFFFFLFTSITNAQNLPLNLLHLPPGFKISLYASVPNARSMTLGAKGTVFVGTLSRGSVYAVIPEKNGSTKTVVIASGLNMPNGVAFYNGALYVAEMDKILRFDDIENHLNNPPSPVVIAKNLPDRIQHGWRYIDFGPDNKLYISIGKPCNTCLEKDKRFGTIMRMNADGSEPEIYASGIRNSIGFAWDPRTNHLWFTENGRDWLGDDSPPDKVNVAPTPGLNFGFPYYDAANLPNPEFGKFPYPQFTPPTFNLPAHVAPLGMAFYTGTQFPAEYHNQAFITLHGSWNRSTKVGYGVITVKIENNKVISAKPFITGWLKGQKEWGRPVDVLMLTDGSLLISDDYAGVIYKITLIK